MPNNQRLAAEDSERLEIDCKGCTVGRRLLSQTSLILTPLTAFDFQGDGCSGLKSI